MSTVLALKNYKYKFKGYRGCLCFCSEVGRVWESVEGVFWAEGRRRWRWSGYPGKGGLVEGLGRITSCKVIKEDFELHGDGWGGMPE